MESQTTIKRKTILGITGITAALLLARQCAKNPKKSSHPAKKMQNSQKNVDSRKKSLPTIWIFHFLDSEPALSRKIRHRVSLLNVTVLNMKCIGRIACVFSRLLRRTGGNIALFTLLGVGLIDLNKDT